VAQGKSRRVQKQKKAQGEFQFSFVTPFFKETTISAFTADSWEQKATLSRCTMFFIEGTVASPS